MDISKNKLLIEYFYFHEKENAENPFLNQPFNNADIVYSYKEAGIQARKIANYINSLGLAPQSNIGLVSKNCAEWIICDLAIMMSGNVSVPYYPTLNGPQINQIIEHSECKLLFVGKLDDWDSMKPGIPKDLSCVSFPKYNPDKSHIQWDQILNDFEPITENFVPDKNDLFTIIYTSGTTGNPKGVMVSYNAFAEALYNLKEVGRMDILHPRLFSYLPLCHIAERNIVEAIAICRGGKISFAENLDTFAKNLQDAKPTHFIAVPRIWSKFQTGILSKLSQNKLDLLLKLPIIKNLIKKKIQKGLGLTDAVLIITGAAPMPTNLILWFRKLGINIQEAYGMTENLGAVSLSPNVNPKDGTVGKLYSNCEVKIDPQNREILTRSPWNMKGYYKEPELTNETIDDENWIHTGDVGELDSENFLKITGRVKEMYKTSKGEYIAPAGIELHFSGNLYIEQICVVGQSMPQPLALIVLSSLGNQLEKDELISELTASLSKVNLELKTYEKIKKIVILKELWTVENNKITPTLKTKRNVIEKEFENMLPIWFDSSEEIVFE